MKEIIISLAEADELCNITKGHGSIGPVGLIFSFSDSKTNSVIVNVP